MTNIESWFIPLDILMMLGTILTIIFAIIFLITIVLNKACHTIPMTLIANSCFAEFTFGSVLLWMAVVTTHNDLKQIQYQDSLCILRSYLEYASYALQNYSYFLQAIYRYIIVVYPTHLFYQSVRMQSLFIVITTIIAFVYPLPFIIKNEIKYIVDEQMCHMPLQLSFLLIYNAFFVYGIPMTGISLIYWKLFRYVKGINRRITSANTLIRATRELKMVRRVVIILIILITIGFPYGIFLLMSFFNRAPKYHFRIAFIFADVLLVWVMIAILQFTDPLKTSLKKIIHSRPNLVIPTFK